MEQRQRIMLIEDSRTQAEQFRGLFERQGWDVVMAHTAESALDQLNDVRPDLVVVDYHLPGMNGDEFCREIRLNVNTRGLPVLMLTVEETGDAERRGLESGADYYLPKSVDPDLLVLRVRALLRQSMGTESVLAPGDTAFSRARLLVIESSPTFMHYLAGHLQGEYYRVEKAGTCAEGFEWIAREAFDCVIVDLETPEAGGIEICRSLSQASSAAREPVAVLALAAQDDKEFMLRALEAGADDLIAKSTDIAVLKARIRALLRRKLLLEENRRIAEELKEKELAAVRARAEAQAAAIRAELADRLAQSNRELRETNRKLKEALDVTRAITEHAAEALFMMDREGRITYANPAAERMLGFRPDELSGLVLHDALHSRRPDGSPYPASECPLRQSLETGITLTGQEEVFLRKDGSAVEVSCSNAPIVEDGEVVAAVLAAHDISERKRSEERLRQSQKLESVGLLAGGVAHDFNNILTGIIGTASLIEEDAATPPDIIEQVRFILSGAEKAADLTRQLLAYSGKGRFIISNVDLSAMVREMNGLIRLSLTKNISVGMELEEGIPPVAADPGQMQQVLMNLVINAGEAIGEEAGGAVSIRTGLDCIGTAFTDSAGTEVAPGDYAFLEVSDTGCGMDEQTAGRIFEPFFTTKFTGRGLGLAAVSGILRSQKGAILVSSTPGQGSTFRALFPAAVAGRSAPEPGRPAILVVDDQECVRKFLCHALERQGYAAIPAVDGAEALARFEEQSARIAVSVIDLTMPVMGGKELVAEVKRRQPGARIVLISANNDSDARDLCSVYPGMAFIQKPFSAQTLIQNVKAAFRQGSAA